MKKLNRLTKQLKRVKKKIKIKKRNKNLVKQLD